jgi:hypothetical protein
MKCSHDSYVKVVNKSSLQSKIPSRVTHTRDNTFSRTSGVLPGKHKAKYFLPCHNLNMVWLVTVPSILPLLSLTLAKEIVSKNYRTVTWKLGYYTIRQENISACHVREGTN